MQNKFNIGDVFIDSVGTVIVIKNITIEYSNSDNNSILLFYDVVITATYKIPTSNELITETLSLKDFINAIKF